MDIKYIREFVKDESGVELIEWLAILGVVAGLIIIAAEVGEKVKSRLSNRCDSFRVGRELLCKMAIGGKTLKIYLAVDADREDIESKKLHFRNMSESKAYSEVPAMIPVKSELCVKKVCEVINIMMQEKGLAQKK